MLRVNSPDSTGAEKGVSMFDELSTQVGQRLRRFQTRRSTLLSILGLGLAGSSLQADAKKRKKKRGKKPPAKPTIQCSISQTQCQNQCVDLRNDGANCGHCGATCGKDSECCGGSCANLHESEQHCGACGHSCGNWQSCCEGVCTDRWSPGFGVGARVASGLWVSPDGKTLWVTELWDSRVAVFRKGSHEWERQTTFATYGNTLDALIYPSALCASPDGATVWIADTLNHRIVEWMRDGEAWTAAIAFGSPGEGPENLSQPEDVVVSADGKTVWIADSINNRVAIWERVEGVWTPTSTFGNTGSTQEQLSGPVGLALAEDESTLWVVEQGKHRISIWSRQGSDWLFSGHFGSWGSQLDQFGNPKALVAAADGDRVWIADSLNSRVVLWQRQSNTWHARGVVQEPSAFPQGAPVDLALTADGTELWIAYESGASQWFATGCAP